MTDRIFPSSPAQEDQVPGEHQCWPPPSPLQPAGEEPERHPGSDRRAEVHRPRVPASQPLSLLDQNNNRHQPSYRSHLRNKGGSLEVMRMTGDICVMFRCLSAPPVFLSTWSPSIPGCSDWARSRRRTRASTSVISTRRKNPSRWASSCRSTVSKPHTECLSITLYFSVPELTVLDGFGRELRSQYYDVGSSLEICCKVFFIKLFRIETHYFFLVGCSARFLECKLSWQTDRLVQDWYKYKDFQQSHGGNQVNLGTFCEASNFVGKWYIWSHCYIW